MIGAVLLYTVLSKTVFNTRKEKLLAATKQLITGVLLAVLVGIGITWFAEGVLNVDIPLKTDTALFLSLAYMSFFLMILSIVSWIGFKGVPVFALILFFGAQLLSLAPEVMPAFYRDWIYPWQPMCFMVDGLRDLFFFGKEFTWNHAATVLSGIGIVSLFVLFFSVLKPSFQKEVAKP